MLKYMNNLFEAWSSARAPFYDYKYKETLFSEFTDYPAKDQDIKAFETAYEFIIYAFFVGLYSGQKKPIIKKENSYGHKIENWGNKTGKLDRKNFSILQKYIFIALIAKTKVDLLALEKGEITEEFVVNQLMETMEGYISSGMKLIREQNEDSKGYFYTPSGFLDFLIRAKTLNTK